MFTGIIETIGTILNIKKAGQGLKMTIRSDMEMNGTKIGDSIAVNGACLTVTQMNGTSVFDVDVSPETFAKTTLSQAKPNDRINLERALILADRIDGHLVSGHVDGIGTIISKQTQDNAVIVKVRIPKECADLSILKGSIAIDGISLTINKLENESVEVSIIPHTAVVTTVSQKKVGDAVNIETDMIGKYIHRFMNTTAQNKESNITKSFLQQAGFI